LPILDNKVLLVYNHAHHLHVICGYFHSAMAKLNCKSDLQIDFFLFAFHLCYFTGRLLISGLKEGNRALNLSSNAVTTWCELLRPVDFFFPVKKLQLTIWPCATVVMKQKVGHTSPWAGGQELSIGGAPLSAAKSLLMSLSCKHPLKCAEMLGLEQFESLIDSS
jgi:hypothetical protein